MSDPIRLVDPSSKCSSDLRELIRAGRTDLPDEQRLHSLALQLGPIVGTKLVAPGAAAAVAVGGGAKVGAAVAGVVKLGAATVVVLGLTTAVYLQAYRQVDGSTRPRAETPSVTTATVGSATYASTSAPAATSESATASALARASRPTLTPTSAPTLLPAPTLTLDRAPASIPTPPASTNPPAEDELTLLQGAADRVRADPSEALALADEHAARFPSGSLAQEREVIAIEALVRLNRAGQARERAKRFARDFPTSAHRLRIEILVGDGEGGAPTHNF